MVVSASCRAEPPFTLPPGPTPSQHPSGIAVHHRLVTRVRVEGQCLILSRKIQTVSHAYESPTSANNPRLTTIAAEEVQECTPGSGRIRRETMGPIQTPKTEMGARHFLRKYCSGSCHWSFHLLPSICQRDKSCGQTSSNHHPDYS